jgi:AbiV family abortive infection protein
MNRNTQRLTAEKLREAGIKSLENASELFREARLLHEHGFWSRAVFLCCISGEELGKCFITLSAVVNHRVGKFNERRYKQRFRAHEEKTGSLNFFEDIFVSSDFPVGQEKIDKATRGTERFKLASLYCDYYGIEPHKPSELITEELAAGALKLAENRVAHFNEHVRPKFDQVLKIDPEEVIRLQNQLFGTWDVQNGSWNR